MTVLLCSATAPTGVLATEDAYQWCVDQDGGGHCDDLVCDGQFATIAAALAAAAGAPDWAGQRPFQQICVSGVHTETVGDVDLSTIGPRVEIRSAGPTGSGLCPDPGAGAVPMFHVYESEPVPGEPFELMFWGMSLQSSSCVTSAVPLAEVDGTGVVVDASTLRERGANVAVLSATPGSRLTVSNSLVEGCDAPLARGTGHVLLRNLEVSGCSLAGAPLVDLTAESSGLHVDRTVLFDNVVSGAGIPLLRTGGDVTVETTSVVGNTTLGGGSLIELLDRGVGTQRTLIRGANVAENAWLGGGSLPAPSAPLPLRGSQRPCQPTGSGGVDLEGRSIRRPGGVATAGVLLRIAGGAAGDSGHLIQLVRSYVVANELGPGGSAVAAEGAVGGIEVHVVHSTLDGFGSEVPLVRSSDASTPLSVFSARNLLFGEAAPVFEAAGPTLVHSVLDEVSSKTAPFAAAARATGGLALAGPPALPVAMDATDPLGEQGCESIEYLCPEVVDLCDRGISEQAIVACPPRVVRDYLVDPSARADLTRPWPFSPSPMPYGGGSTLALAGAQGFGCESGVEPSADEIRSPDGQTAGDGDGYPEWVDCDNEDPTVTPAVPSLDGFSMLQCDDTGVDCYDCPGEDADGDLYSDLIDCDDSDPARHPEAVEQCDAVDWDCDGEPSPGGDTDGDGTVDCEDDDDDGDGSPDADDCGPLDGLVFPGASESCDDVDSDCDGSLVDDFDDADADGLPDCIDEDADNEGVLPPDDCDDTNAGVHPGGIDTCDAIDQDCDGDLVEGFEDADGDGLPDCVPVLPDGCGVIGCGVGCGRGN